MLCRRCWQDKYFFVVRRIAGISTVPAHFLIWTKHQTSLDPRVVRLQTQHDSLAVRLSLIFSLCWQDIFYLMGQELPKAMRHFSGFAQLSFPDEDLPVSPAFTEVLQWRREEMPASQWIPNWECEAQSGLLQEVVLIQLWGLFYCARNNACQYQEGCSTSVVCRLGYCHPKI